MWRGVAKGFSSAFILLAMKENHKGNLYSIDLPPYEVANEVQKYRSDDKMAHILEDQQVHEISSTEYEIGCAIPENIRRRWHLIIGDSRQYPPKLLNDLGKVDIFRHDSIHTSQHMLHEFMTVWPLIVPELGFLTSDDVF